jgi:single-strand DNA-binding protein
MGIRVNNVVIGGTVGKDPEVRFTANGKPVASFSIAIDAGKDKEAEWFEVTAWEQQAELAQKFIIKGSQVIVVGRLQQSKWEEKDGGGKRSKVVVVANNIQLVGGKRKEDGGGEPAAITDADIPF